MEPIISNGEARGPRNVATAIHADTVESAQARARNTLDIDAAQNSAEIMPIVDESLWRKNCVLVIDGGGIRGFSAGLTIKYLLVRIMDLEAYYRSNPENQGDLPELRTFTAAMSVPASDVPKACHYFDLVAGTSTGALLAIMMSRLRLGIDTCLREYRIIGDLIFGYRNERLFHERSKLWSARAKYSAAWVHRVYHEMIERHIPVMVAEDTGAQRLRGREIRYPNVKENVCGTSVCLLQVDPTGEDVFDDLTTLMRSYKTNQERDPTTGNLRNAPTFRTSADETQPAKICDVAQAVTAADGYWRDAKIENCSYRDAAFGNCNPSLIVLNDVVTRGNWGVPQRSENHIKNQDVFHVFLSIGTGMKRGIRDRAAQWAATGRRHGHRGFAGIIKRIQRGASRVTETELTHGDMLRLSQVNGDTFFYARLNCTQELGRVKLDDWKTNRSKWSQFWWRCKPSKHRSGLQDQPIQPTQASSGQYPGPCGKPGKYKTLETIFEKTRLYIDDSITRVYAETTKELIDRVAKELVRVRRGRQAADEGMYRRYAYEDFEQV